GPEADLDGRPWFPQAAHESGDYGLEDVLILQKVLGNDQHPHSAASSLFAASKATTFSNHPDSCSGIKPSCSNRRRSSGMSRMRWMWAAGACSNRRVLFAPARRRFHGEFALA